MQTTTEARAEKLTPLMVQRVDKKHQLSGYMPLSKNQLQEVSQEITHLYQQGIVQDKHLKGILSRLRKQCLPISAIFSDNRMPLSTADHTTTVDDDEQTMNANNQKTLSILKRNHNKLQQQQPASSRNNSNNNGTSANGFPKRLSELHDEKQEDIWGELAKTDVALYLREKEVEKGKERMRKEQQKLFLDQQITNHQKQKQIQRHKEIQFAKEEAEKVTQWLRDERARKEKKIAQIREEKAFRTQQIEEHHHRKQIEEQSKRKEEEEMCKRVADELVLDQQRAIEKKEKTREDVVKFLRYNQQQQELKSKMKNEERVADQQRNEKFLQKISELEQLRISTIQTITKQKERHEELATKLQENLLAKRTLVMDKSEQEQIAIQNKRISVEVEGKLKRERAKIKTMLLLEEQMREREMVEMKTRQEAYEQKLLLDQNVQNAAAREEEQKEAKRRSKLSHRQELEKQIESDKRRIELSHNAMAPIEKKMNSKLLKNLQMNATL